MRGLAKLILKYQISKNASNELLTILRQQRTKTLLKTQRQVHTETTGADVGISERKKGGGGGRGALRISDKGGATMVGRDVPEKSEN